ncbi:N-formylglutamate amidohydrolase [Lichenihabitans sp. Uapishka_5]|uniref:N-formylglutamate amidohydrolase n=1 Tax=Lichenihabitans sp. Uapishka_5 TaxID=3037302 RepID=UPI0029E7F8FF|nr:N-formylglutamate amidohydrolase [Lichenihabitans sp. Uapishka_5]MDX7953778.1 N-formylglutamate amidohydrolase [Lichenihabitans sp. Uapishka_5]
MPHPAPPAGTEPAPVIAIEGDLSGGLLLLCDHASNRLPARYGDLGLDRAQFERHIAYDIGAETVTRTMAAILKAPALMTTFSRLLIDPNRGCRDPTLVMRISDGAIVPGNAAIGTAEVEERTARFWQPYRDRIDATLDAMLATGRPPAVVSIHSFTPSMKGVRRPWHVGLLWDDDPRLALPLAKGLADQPSLQPAAERIGDNEPYDGALPGDTIDIHATRRGLANVLIEVRQDLIGDDASASNWGVRLAQVLAPVLRRPDIGSIRYHPSRAGRPGRRLADLDAAP